MMDSTLTLGNLISKNRLVLAPMTTYSSSVDGVITEDELRFLQSRAEDGFGIVMTAACYVHKTGHAFPGQWRCDEDEVIETSLRLAAEAIRRGGAKSVLQIHHGGRACKPELSGRVLSASAIPYPRPNAVVPEAMTSEEISEIIHAFASAAARAEQAGFDAVEIHGANTYLLQQFVSPHSNRREDAYGVDRNRFSREVVAAVLGAVSPGYPIGYRFSPEESESPGIRIENTLSLIEELCASDLAFLHISLSSYMGTSLNQSFEGPTINKVLSAIKERKPLIAVGGVTNAADVMACLELGAQAVAVGKAAISDPECASKLLRGGTASSKFPRSGAAEKLNIPLGLEQRILGAPGWFELED